jgi:hypothetical protein
VAVCTSSIPPPCCSSWMVVAANSLPPSQPSQRQRQLRTAGERRRNDGEGEEGKTRLTRTLFFDLPHSTLASHHCQFHGARLATLVRSNCVWPPRWERANQER